MDIKTNVQMLAPGLTAIVTDKPEPLMLPAGSFRKRLPI